MPHICFVLLDAYSLFNDETTFVFGGAEVRGNLLAKGLSGQPGFRVSCVVRDHGQPPVEQYGAVTVYAHTGYGDPREQRPPSDDIELKPSFPFVRIKRLSFSTVRSLIVRGGQRLIDRLKPGAVTIDGYPLPQAKYTIYDQINADIYCQFGTISRVAELAAYCHIRGKKFVLFGASDRDFIAADSGDPLKHVDAWSLKMVRYIVDHAHLIITQTQQQAELLRQNYGHESFVLSNPVDLSEPVINEDREYALWVGKSDPKKDPMLFIDLARRCPEISFMMILNRVDEMIHHNIHQNRPDNVEILEFVPYAEIDGCFQRAFMLVNTSPMEGFPNTFLQAGKQAVPVLSYRVDVDGYIEREACGIVAYGDFERMVTGLREIYADSENRYGRHHRTYVEQNHNLADKVRLLAEALVG